MMTPLAPGRYKLRMTIGAATVDKLRRAQDLLRHVIPDGDPAAIVDRALTLLLDQVARTKLAATDRPRTTRLSSRTRTRHVPAEVRRAVWARDEGRCAFVGREGRCAETGFLELHHIEPYALGGATTVEGIALRCRAHNAYEADREFKVLEHATASGGSRESHNRQDSKSHHGSDHPRYTAPTSKASSGLPCCMPSGENVGS